MTSLQAADGKAPILSICIPTYNRGPFLQDLLNSIVAQIADLPPGLAALGVEIVISDNASCDDTPDRIEAFHAKLALTYVRQPTNIGPDRNFLAVVKSARGNFCWLMGSDDVLEQGGLKRVMHAAAEWNVAGFSVNYHRRSFDLQETSDIRPPVRYREDIIVDGRELIYRDFVGHWGYLSGQVIRRDLWDAVCTTGEQRQFLNGYVHVLIMGRMIERLPRWGYIHAICVGWRGRNDSFVSGDHVHRMMIDVVGYRAITERLFGRNGATTAAVMNEVAGTHVLVHYRIAKVFNHSSATLRQAAGTLIREYWRYPAFWTKLLPWMIIPAPLLHGIWIGYQRGRHRLNHRFRIHPQARRRVP